MQTADFKSQPRRQNFRSITLDLGRGGLQLSAIVNRRLPGRALNAARLLARAEIESMAALPNIQIERLPKGKLSLHEEFPDEVVSVIRPFLFEETGPFCLVVSLG